MGVRLRFSDYNANATWDVDDNPGGGDGNHLVTIHNPHVVSITVANDAATDTVTIEPGGMLHAARGVVDTTPFGGALILLNGGTLSYNHGNLSRIVGGNVRVMADSKLRQNTGGPNAFQFAQYGTLDFAPGPGDGNILEVYLDDGNLPPVARFMGGAITNSGVIDNTVSVGLEGTSLAAGSTLTKRGTGLLQISPSSVFEGPIALEAGTLFFLSNHGLRTGSLNVPAGATLMGQRLETRYSWNAGASQPTITLEAGSTLRFVIDNQFWTPGGNIVVAGDTTINSTSGNIGPFAVIYNALAFAGDGHAATFTSSDVLHDPKITRFSAASVNYDAIFNVALTNTHVELEGLTFAPGKTLVKRGVGRLHFATTVGSGGNLTIEAGSVTTMDALDFGVLTFDLRGTTPDVDYGQLIMGAFGLANTRLDLSASGLTPDDTFVLITRTTGAVALNNLNGDPIPEGGAFLSGDNAQWQLTYLGGDGNDVAVTFVSDTPLPVVTVGGSFTALDKLYDGTTVATIETNTLVLVGVAPGDDVSLIPVAAFESSSVGYDKTVGLTGASTLGGADAGAYTLSLDGAPTTQADILREVITYYVRTNGFDTANGLAPEDDGTNGPMLTVVHAFTTALSGDTVDVGPGRFQVATTTQYGLIFTKAVHVHGAGSALTTLDGTNAGVGILQFYPAGGGRNTEQPTTISGMTLDAVHPSSYGILFVETVAHIRFEDVVLRPTDFAWRMQSNQPPGQWMEDIYLQDFDIPPGGVFWIKTTSDNNQPFQMDGWTFDGGDWQNVSANSFYGTPGLALRNITVKGGFTFRENRMSFFDTSGHVPNLNYEGVGGVGGQMRFENATFRDNSGAGVDLRNLFSDVSLIVSNCTFADTGVGHLQTVGIRSSVELGVELGAIRLIGGVWDELDFGMTIEDNGATQSYPIELKDIDFGNTATGLVINGWAANLWYVCPDLSGASIDEGGVLVSGGRMTCYGDINLDGVVDQLDTALAMQYYPMASNATWRTGDFNFDGVFDHLDLIWLPQFTGGILIVR